MNTIIDGHEAVDMGGSVYWATKNVGAQEITQTGNFFMWGTTKLLNNSYYKNRSSLELSAFRDPDYYRDILINTIQSEYPYVYFYVNGSSLVDVYTKYIPQKAASTSGYDYSSIDGKLVLEPEDDAATVNMGGGWRTPTLNEWKELWDSTYFKGYGGYLNEDYEGLYLQNSVGTLYFPVYDYYDVYTDFSVPSSHRPDRITYMSSSVPTDSTISWIYPIGLYGDNIISNNSNYYISSHISLYGGSNIAETWFHRISPQLVRAVHDK